MNKEAVFYNLTTLPKTKVIPKLLEKIVNSGQRVLFFLPDIEQMNIYDDLLWSYSSKVFLPHALDKDPYPEKQLILLSTNTNNPHNASNLLCLNPQLPNYIPESINKLIFIAEDKVEQEKMSALIPQLQQKNYSLVIYQQQFDNSWQKTTETILC